VTVTGRFAQLKSYQSRRRWGQKILQFLLVKPFFSVVISVTTKISTKCKVKGYTEFSKKYITGKKKVFTTL